MGKVGQAEGESGGRESQTDGRTDWPTFKLRAEGMLALQMAVEMPLAKTTSH